MEVDRGHEVEVDKVEATFREVDECLSRAVTLLTNLILEEDIMQEHSLRMASLLLNKLNYMKEKEMLDVEKKREFLRTLRAQLSYHLRRVEFGNFQNPVHTRKLRQRKPVEVIPDDII